MLLQEVAIMVVTCEAACWVRLLDKESKELFAECPVPTDQPLVTVIRFLQGPLWTKRQEDAKLSTLASSEARSPWS